MQTLKARGTKAVENFKSFPVRVAVIVLPGKAPEAFEEWSRVVEQCLLNWQPAYISDKIYFITKEVSTALFSLSLQYH